MADLKPCPFCGAEATISRRGDRRESTLYMCTECGCTLETSETFNHGADWNCRSLAPPTEGEVDALAKVLIDYNGLPHDSIGKGIAMGKARAALAAFVAGRTGG